MVTLAFSADNGHAMLLGVALCSILENRKGSYPVVVYVIDGGISSNNKRRLRQLELSYGFSLSFLTPDPGIFPVLPAKGPYPNVCLYRLSIGSLLPASCSRVLYLDCDTICTGDIQELFSQSLEGNTVAAVPDIDQDERRQHMRRLSGIDGEYFNSGVLLIDVDRWRRTGAEKRLLDFAHKDPAILWFADQDVLNPVLSGDWKALEARYNSIPGFSEARELPFLIHFAGLKPWYTLPFFIQFRWAKRRYTVLDIPYREHYRFYANRTPWRFRKYRKIAAIDLGGKDLLDGARWAIRGGYRRGTRWLRGRGHALL